MMKSNVKLKRRRYEYSIGEKELLSALGMEGNTIESIKDVEGIIEITTTDNAERLKDSELKAIVTENPFKEEERTLWENERF